MRPIFPPPSSGFSLSVHTHAREYVEGVLMRGGQRGGDKREKQAEASSVGQAGLKGLVPLREVYMLRLWAHC